jgi:RNA polymerase sigma factor (sigma-70 family)
MIALHEAALRRTARRYSLDAEDADDAFQRALEIVLTKAPTTDARELIRWTQTVTKHEALALRQSRERLLGYSGGSAAEQAAADPVALIPAPGEGPEEQVERREAIARSREALRALKPAELRALSLRAEGYSYAEIGELTGFSQTKINRVLAEGRDRFRHLVSSSEDGSRCRELRPLLSAFCDGETSPRDSATVREHLRACGHCRSTMRAYRAAPRIAIALAPALPPPRSLLERAHDLLSGLGARLPGVGGAGGDSAVTQIAVSGGSKGAGMAALAKLLALCAGAAGGAAACVATGVLPAPDLSPQAHRPAIERSAPRPTAAQASEAVQYEPSPVQTPVAQPEPKPKPEPPAEETTESPSVEAPAGAVEYEPPPAPEPPSPSGGESSSSSSAAGEFGP